MPYAIACAAVFAWGAVLCRAADEPRPNVILVITDDQGYGDVGAHGNTMLKTPHLDRLHAQSVRLTNFHVDPTCSPTRSALMTGRYSTRTGVWHTIAGRSLMNTAEVTLAEVFAANGYDTALFGKWHLGDNFPLRPQDQGFQKCLYLGGGGVTQTPDFWGNDYFDDTYRREDGSTQQCQGYCTDVWFDHALQFIESQRERPFFCYIATNAPHGPYLVAEDDKRPYVDAGVPEPMASFYGMIANIDENIGRLVDRLDELRQLACAPPHFDRLVLGQRDAGRVVPAVLEAAEPVEQDRHNRFGSEIADDAAHISWSPLSWLPRVTVRCSDDFFRPPSPRTAPDRPSPATPVRRGRPCRAMRDRCSR